MPLGLAAVDRIANMRMGSGSRIEPAAPEGFILITEPEGLAIDRVQRTRWRRSGFSALPLSYPAMAAGVGFEPTTSPSTEDNRAPRGSLHFERDGEHETMIGVSGSRLWSER